MDIQYTLIDSSLGRLLVARTDRGICAVYPGDTDAALERQLADEFPSARSAARWRRHSPRRARCAMHSTRART